MPKPKADAVTIELNADGMQAFRSGTRPPDEVLKIMLSHKHAVRYPVSINPANKCCMMRCASCLAWLSCANAAASMQSHNTCCQLVEADCQPYCTAPVRGCRTPPASARV